MGEQVVDFFEWMRLLSPAAAYVLIALIAYGENLLPPVPGDLVIVFGGYLAGAGELSYVAVVVVSTVSGALGFMTMFWLGHRFGDAALDPDRLKWLPKQRIYTARKWLLKWGYLIVALNRFLSGLRSVIALTVGAAQMHAGRAAFFATVSALIWASLIAYAGVLVGENWTLVAEYLRRYGKFVAVLLAILVVVQLVRWTLRRHGASDDSSGINK